MEQRNRGYESRKKNAAVAWVLLAYRLPREPSTPRITVWRKLRQLGAVQIVDGLVALPSSNRTSEQLNWLAEQIMESSGDAWIWEATLPRRAQSQALIDAMVADASAEYEDVVRKAAQAMRQDATMRGRTLARLRRELHRIEGRDYFGASAKQDALRAIEKLAVRMDEAKA